MGQVTLPWVGAGELWSPGCPSSAGGAAAPLNWFWLNNPLCPKAQPGWGSASEAVQEHSHEIAAILPWRERLWDPRAANGVQLLNAEPCMLLPEPGCPRHSTMAVIARASLAGAGAASCNGTLL